MRILRWIYSNVKRDQIRNDNIWNEFEFNLKEVSPILFMIVWSYLIKTFWDISIQWYSKLSENTKKKIETDQNEHRKKR
jgi:hypothetical protein